MAPQTAVAPPLVSAVFRLLDRNNVGLAEEGDVLAAVQCAVASEDRARRMLARVGAGPVDLMAFGVLIGACLESSRSGADADSAAVSEGTRAGRLLLEVTRDFERRAKRAKSFRDAAAARECAELIRSSEEQRQLEELTTRQQTERRSVKESHESDASQFSLVWQASLQEYERSAQQVMAELSQRQEAALADFMARQREQVMQKQHRHSRQALEAIKVQEKLVRTGKYLEASRHSRQVNELLRRDEASMVAAAEAEAQRRVSIFRERQRREMEGLRARIDRNRAEQQGHWKQKAGRMVLAQRNAVTELGLRQAREAERAQNNIHVTLAPPVPTPRKRHPDPSLGVKGAPRNPAVLVEQRPGTAPASKAQGKAAFAAPPPRQRPSKMFGAVSLMQGSGSSPRPHTAACVPAGYGRPNSVR